MRPVRPVLPASHHGGPLGRSACRTPWAPTSTSRAADRIVFGEAGTPRAGTAAGIDSTAVDSTAGIDSTDAVDSTAGIAFDASPASGDFRSLGGLRHLRHRRLPTHVPSCGTGLAPPTGSPDGTRLRAAAVRSPRCAAVRPPA